MPTTEGDKKHAAVLTRFNDEISAGTIQVHRKFSDAATKDFGPNYFDFDWIYVDSIHTYDGVRNDLEQYFPLVRDGGFIMAHDFTNPDGARKWNFEVVEAVHDFLRLHDCTLIAVTQEKCPTYLIMKRHYRNCFAYQTIHRVLTQNAQICFDVLDHMLGQLRHKETSGPHGLRCWFGF